MGGRLVLGIALTGAAVAAAVAWTTGRWVSGWERVGVAALVPPFADTRAYTTAWECARRGVDPFVANPCDPEGKRLVPPRLPVELSFLGLGESATVPIALALVAAFVLCLFVIAGPITARRGLLYAAIVLSPSILLGIERANTDLLVFALLTVVLVTLRSRAATWRTVAYVALVLATLIKVYPLFAAGVLLRQPPRRAAFALAAVLVPSAVYAVLTLGDLRSSVEDMTRAKYLSWGALVVFDALGFSTGPAALLALGAVAVAVGGSIWLARRLGARVADGEGDTRELDAFWIGACVYLGTFVAGTNFDYKLVFLVFAVPQLLRWSASPAPRVPHAGWALAVLVAALWLSTSVRMVAGVNSPWLDALAVFPFDELFTWSLFVYLATALWLTLPEWVLREATRAIRGRRARSPGRLATGFDRGRGRQKAR